MSFAPLSFTGVSTYSDDFQTILKRSAQIASLPMQALQNDQQSAIERKAAWTEIRTSLTALSAKLHRLGELGAGQSLSATSSGSAVSATVNGAAQAGAYVIGNVKSLARATTATTITALATPDSTKVNAAGDYLQLVVGGTAMDLNLTPATNNLKGVAEAINRSSAGVTASVITTDEGSSLSITAAAAGERTIELRTVKDAAGSNLLQATVAGKNADFEVNGKRVTRGSNTIDDVIAGVSLTLNGTTAADEKITVTLSADRAPLVAAVEDFANTYNTLTAKLDTQVGTANGALSGDMLLGDLRNELRKLVSYQGDNPEDSLAGLGLSFDARGVITADSSAIYGLSAGGLDKVFRYLGSASTGLGGFTANLSRFSDPFNGAIQMQLDGYDATDRRLSSQVAEMTARVQSMQATLLAQLQAADTVLARLESQQGMLTATIDSLNLVTYGRKNG